MITRRAITRLPRPLGRSSMDYGSSSRSYPWDIRQLQLVGSFAAGSNGDTQGMAMSPNGWHCYCIGQPTLAQYDLTVPWDITTAAVAGTYTITETGSPSDIAWSPDGLHFYVPSNNVGVVFQYDLATAWEISTAAYANKSISISGQGTNPKGLSLSPDGTRMVVIFNSNKDIVEYSLSTPWDISTATVTGTTKDTSVEVGNPDACYFRPDGMAILVSDKNTGYVWQYELLAPFDLAGAFCSGVYGDASAETLEVRGVSIPPQGKAIYLAGYSPSTVYQYAM